MAENNRERITRLAGRLRLMLLVAMGLSALLYLAARLGFSWGDFHVVTQTAHSLSVTLARDLSIALLFVALWQLERMLALVQRGERFSPPVTRHFRRFALFLLLAASVLVVAPFAAMLGPDPDPHRMHIPLNFRDLWTMMITGALFLVARLLDEAQRIEADLDEIV